MCPGALLERQKCLLPYEKRLPVDYFSDGFAAAVSRYSGGATAVSWCLLFFIFKMRDCTATASQAIGLWLQFDPTDLNGRN